MGIFNFLHLQMQVKEKTGSFYRNVEIKESEKLLNDFKLKQVSLKRNLALIDLQDKDIEIYLYFSPVSLYFERVDNLEKCCYFVAQEETSVIVLYKEKGEKLRQLPIPTGRVEKLEDCWFFIETTRKEEKTKVLFTYEQGRRLNLLEGEDIQVRDNDYGRTYLFVKQKDSNGYEVYEIYNDRCFLKVLPYFLKKPTTIIRGINALPIVKEGKEYNLLACSLANGGFYVFGLYDRIDSINEVESISCAAYIEGRIHIYPRVPYGYLTLNEASSWHYQEIEGSLFEIMDSGEQIFQVRNTEVKDSCIWQIYRIKYTESEENFTFEFVNAFREKVKMGEPKITSNGLIYPFVPCE